MPNKEKIAANVVTYNRKDLLRECLNSLLAQTRKPDSIIIVDNNSNDGTKEMLEKEFLDNPIFDYVRLNENTGSAGGQYTGIKRAYEKGFDWVWCMDDDGSPSQSALYILLKEKINNALLNCLVVDDKEKEYLGFGLKDRQTGEKYFLVKEAQKRKCIYHVNPFNGTLISKKIIKKNGYPDKSFFIYGDEKEYLERIYKNGFSLVTLTDSIFYHPGVVYKSLVNKEKRDLPAWKRYYLVRNTMRLNTIYKLGNNFFYFFKSLCEAIFALKQKRSQIKAVIVGAYHYFLGVYGKYEKAFSF